MNERSIVLPRAARPPRRSRRLLDVLDSPGDALACLGPNWFASVMGTGIVAVAATLLPEPFAGQHQLAMAAWLLAAARLAVLLAATAVPWICYPQTARRHALDPAMAPFSGAPPNGDADRRCRRAARRPSRDRHPRRCRSGLDSVGGRHPDRLGRGRDLPDVHGTRAEPRRHPGVVADAGRAADGLGGYRRRAD